MDQSALTTEGRVGMRSYLLIVVLAVSYGCNGDTVVLHRVGNPPSTYIAKFDALGDLALNELSCEEFRGFVHAMSPETGKVICSKL